MQADLEEVAASGKKAIVFSQWVGTLRTPGRASWPASARWSITARRRNRSATTCCGSSARIAAGTLLLMSYGAGSVGLNLQFSEYVFLFDRWWNPAVEDQAINRAHRIGAAGPVTVTRFLSLNTIEQRIDQVLDEKRELFDTIFSDTAPRQKLLLSQEEIFGLFHLKCSAPPGKTAA